MFLQLEGKIGVRRQNMPQPGKRPHDGNVNRDRPFAIQHTRQHGHFLFGKCHRRGA